MHYEWFEQDIETAWSHHLITEWYKIQSHVRKHSDKYLPLPNFKINAKLHHAWGMWHKDTRTITISLDLLKKFEWAAVVHVLKHETAHQIVDELLHVNAKPHGETWHLACDMVGIPHVRCDSQANLDSFKGQLPSNPAIETIRKLIIHGNDCAVTKEESQLFLNKAQSLMIKYNIDANTIHGIEHNNTFYAFRPVGPIVDGHRAWLGFLANMVCDYYNVSCIWIHCSNKQMRLEFYGTPDNLDIAEYVFHALITQAEYLYEQYKQQKQEKQNRLNAFRNASPQPLIDWSTYFLNLSTTELQQAHLDLTQALNDAHEAETTYYPDNRISKRAFMKGLVAGYSAKLSTEKTIIFDKIKAEDKAIIHRASKVLRDKFEDYYHPTNFSYGHSRGAGYSDGHKAGSNLTLSQGIHSNGNRSLQLK